LAVIFSLNNLIVVTAVVIVVGDVVVFVWWSNPSIPRYEVTNLQVVAEPWDPSGSMELARLGGTQALASSHWSYGASSQGQSSDEVGAVRGGSFDADVGKDGENDDDDDDAGPWFKTRFFFFMNCLE